MKQTHFRWIVASGALLALGVVFHFSKAGPSSPAIQPLPLVLTRIQALGDLHTARHTYENVFEYATSREPVEWASSIPGVGQLVEAGTRNVVLVSTQSQVEAGVDLSLARIEKSGSQLTVWLPQPKTYEPQTTAKIHWHKSAPFWRDDNIALKAERDAAARARRASVEQDILQKAAEEARGRIETMVKDLGYDVEVRFS